MRRIEPRIESLESVAGVLVDDLDSGVVEMCELVAKSKGETFGLDNVPRGVTVGQVLKEISKRGRSRGANVIRAEAERRSRYGRS